jgi:hypothetical protein
MEPRANTNVEWSDHVLRLREKNVANMADKKKTLEIAALFCGVLVRHLADKE